ncbi:MAG: tetratricopeptide repeat protein, partial [Actinomycetota bacterium]|nr:tetratricopeptide repeat protein [Actinomycetota bacterium]
PEPPVGPEPGAGPVEPEPGIGPAGPVVGADLGRPVPLSQSGAWLGLRDFYTAEGVSAWDGKVPYHITSNPVIADCYANVIVRFVGDVVATGRFDPAEPFYIVELGAGSGTFSFHLLRRLTELTRALGVGGVRITYVMTDVVEANINFWRQHPQLHPFVATGLLAFGRFDVMSDHAVHLIAPEDGGEVEELAAFANPPIVIANYMFDSVPQDWFRVTDGRLEIMAVTVTAASENGSGPPRSTRLLGTRQPTEQPSYGDAEVDALLADRLRRSEGMTVVFPIAALRCLRRLVDAGAGRLCLLASDLSTHEAPIGDVDLELVGGLFYLPVDLTVIGEYLGRLGRCWHRACQSEAFDTSLSIVGFGPDELRETEHAFSTLIDTFGPRGHRLVAGLAARVGRALQPEQWLALAALLRYDPRMLDESVTLVTAYASSGVLTAHQRRELMMALDRLADNTYWLPGQADTVFNIGVILHEFAEVEAAIAMFIRSLEAAGDSAETLFSLGLCQQSLGRHAAAVDSFRRALALDPRHVLARGWIAQIQADLSARGRPGVEGL